MSPPSESAVRPVNGSESHTGTPRGSQDRYDEHTQKWFRVRVDENGMIDPEVIHQDGNTTQSTPVLFNNRLSYVLQARDGRRIPINTTELADWLNRYYQPGLSKKNIPAIYVKPPEAPGMWRGHVAHVPLHQGAWWVKQSDESVLLIPQQHTAPLKYLRFDLDASGTVRAHYPEMKNGPVADQIAKPGSYRTRIEKNA